MTIRTLLIACSALTLAVSIQNDASAARRVRSNPSPTPTTILPSRQEVSAVPVPEQGRAVAYPVDVVRYGRTVLPGSRAVRIFLDR